MAESSDTVRDVARRNSLLSMVSISYRSQAQHKPGNLHQAAALVPDCCRSGLRSGWKRPLTRLGGMWTVYMAEGHEALPHVHCTMPCTVTVNPILADTGTEPTIDVPAVKRGVWRQPGTSSWRGDSHQQRRLEQVHTCQSVTVSSAKHQQATGLLPLHCSQSQQAQLVWAKFGQAEHRGHWGASDQAGVWARLPHLSQPAASAAASLCAAPMQVMLSGLASGAEGMCAAAVVYNHVPASCTSCRVASGLSAPMRDPQLSQGISLCMNARRECASTLQQAPRSRTEEQARLNRLNSQVPPHAQLKLEQAGPAAKPTGGLPDLSMFPDSAGPVSPIGPLAQDGGEWDDEGDDLCDGDDDTSMGGACAAILRLRAHVICQVLAVMHASVCQKQGLQVHT